MKKSGPKTDPWGTPQARWNGMEERPATLMDWVRLVKYDVIHFSASPVTPFLDCSLLRSISCDTVSKAADKSRRTRNTHFPLSMAV